MLGKETGPAVSALSASSDMSQWLNGTSRCHLRRRSGGSLIAVGLTIGAWLNWKLIAPRLRPPLKANDSLPFQVFDNRFKENSKFYGLFPA